MANSYKPILCLDFDGVIHQYTSPWTHSHEIHDHVTEGFFEWAEEANKYFKLVIYSSRSKNPKAIVAMQLWFVQERKLWRERGGQHKVEDPLEFEFASEKPAAFLTIDDRAICFNGDWSSSLLFPDNLLNFKPWNKK